MNYRLLRRFKKAFRYRYPATAVVAVLFLLVLFQNGTCVEGTTSVGTMGTNLGAATGTATGSAISSGTSSNSPSLTLSISPNNTVSFNGQVSVIAENGSGNYSYSLSPGCFLSVLSGNATATTGAMVYQYTTSMVAPGTVCTVTVTDIANPALQASGAMIAGSDGISSMVLNVSSTNLGPNSSVTLTVAGGEPPYTYAVLNQGVGGLSPIGVSGNSTPSPAIASTTATSVLYFSPTKNANASVQIQVTDSSGVHGLTAQTASTTLTITKLSPPSTQLNAPPIEVCVDKDLIIAYSNINGYISGNSYFNDPSTNAPTFTFLGTQGGGNNVGANCNGQAAKNAIQQIALSNFQTDAPYPYAYVGTLSATNNRGSFEVTYCIDPSDTTQVYVLNAGPSSVISNKFDFTRYTSIFNGLPVQAADVVNLDNPSGSGNYSITVLGSYSNTKLDQSDCASFKSNSAVMRLYQQPSL